MEREGEGWRGKEREGEGWVLGRWLMVVGRRHEGERKRDKPGRKGGRERVGVGEEQEEICGRSLSE
jgi:hypothetical protein